MSSERDRPSPRRHTATFILLLSLLLCLSLGGLQFFYCPGHATADQDPRGIGDVQQSQAPIPPPAPPDTAPVLRADEKWRQTRDLAQDKGDRATGFPQAPGAVVQERPKSTAPTRVDTGLKITRFRDHKLNRLVDVRADEVLVKFREMATRADIHKVRSHYKAAPAARRMTALEKTRYYRVPVPAGVTLAAFLSELRKDASVQSADVNPIVRSQSVPGGDPLLKQQWALDAVHAREAWNVTQGAPSVAIAIIDSGVDANHPDLKANLVPGYDFIRDNVHPKDDLGHGTQVAGIVAAANGNGIGISGGAPRCRIMPLRVLDANGEGTVADLAEAIIYAADGGARVLNLALGTYAASDTLREAVEYAAARNCVVVAAGGNNGTSEPCYPAAYPSTIAVAAVDRSRRPCFTSNHAAYIDVSAPGGGVLTTARDGKYENLSETSAAAAHVSALAGLLVSLRPNRSYESIQAAIRATATDLGAPGWDPGTGFGLVNYAAALTRTGGISLTDVGIVDLGSLPRRPLPGQTVHVAVTLRNHGVYTITRCNTFLAHDGQTVSTATIQQFEPKQTRTVDFCWASAPNAQPSIQTLMANITPLAGETSTDDNRRPLHVLLVAAEEHDVAILDVATAGAPLGPGSTVTIGVEIANLGNVLENDVQLRCTGRDLDSPAALSLNPGERKTVFLEWTVPVETSDLDHEVPWYGLTFEVMPVAGETDTSNNRKELDIGYMRGEATVVPLHTCGTGNEVHQWIAKEAYDYFQDQVDESSIPSGNRISAHLGQWNWDWDNFGDPRTTLLEGTWAEDQANHNPEVWYVDYNMIGPYVDHFCSGGDGGELFDGLGPWNAAYVRANWYWVDYATASYGSSKSSAYYYLVSVAESQSPR